MTIKMQKAVKDCNFEMWVILRLYQDDEISRTEAKNDLEEYHDDFLVMVRTMYHYGFISCEEWLEAIDGVAGTYTDITNILKA